MASATEYDVAIVGGGHNGLTAGCYLARDGRKVVVIEAAEKVGGMCSSGHLIPEAPEHLIHPCALDLMSLRVHPMVPEELELSRYGYRQEEMRPGYVYCHPDGNTLIFGRTPEETAADIRRFSSADADAYIELLKTVNVFIDLAIPMMRVDPAQQNIRAKLAALGVLLRNRKLRPEIVALAGSPAYTTIMERFEHPITQSALCCLLGAAGPIANEGTGVYFALLGFVQRFGLGRPIGGMQSISNALAARFRDSGGEIMTSAPVAEIVARSGRVEGVRLQDGTVIRAGAVIAAIHPKPALEMVTPGALDRRTLTRVALAPANAHGASPFKVDLALSGQVSFSRLEALRPEKLNLRKSVLLIGTADAVIHNFRASARGEVPTQPYLWITAPTSMDPGQAPAGQDVAYLYPVAMPIEPREGWDEIRDRVGQQVVDWAAEYMEGLKELEIGRRLEAAPDLAARLNAPNGCVVHIDTASTRTGGMRPAAGLGGDTLPVAGLFLGSAGMHPGGGINGLPGRIAAGRVGRFLTKR